MLLIYPLSLPSPSSAPIQAAERRALGPASGPFEARALQLDRLARQQISFPIMTGAEAAALRTWWEGPLVQGGAWFLSSWPSPQGAVAEVRRFISPLRWDFIAGGFWRASGECEVRGRGLNPRRPPWLGLHFDGGYEDVGGHHVDAVEWSYSVGFPTFVSGKFGKQAVSFSQNAIPIILTNVFGDFNLNATGEWQISFWVRIALKPDGLGGGGGLLQMFAAAQNGSSYDGTGTDTEAPQFEIRFNGATESEMSFAYANVNPSDGLLEYNYLQAIDPAAIETVPVDDGVFHFFAICGDATSTRAYVNEVLAFDDRVNSGNAGYPPIFPPGSRPMYANASAPFSKQVIAIGGVFAGGRDEAVDPPWPARAVFSAWFGGDIQDLKIDFGPGSVEYTGATIVAPIAPFSG